ITFIAAFVFFLSLNFIFVEGEDNPFIKYNNPSFIVNDTTIAEIEALIARDASLLNYPNNKNITKYQNKSKT
ncbi:MAG: hypothetical protein QW480_01730, partial [Candidatus Aenigmatarchaeota archaeon]